MDLYCAEYKFTCEWDDETFASMFFKRKPKHKIELVEFTTDLIVYAKDENDAIAKFKLLSKHWLHDKAPGGAGNWNSRPEKYNVTKKEIQVKKIYPNTFVYLRANMMADQFIRFIQDVQVGDYK